MVTKQANATEMGMSDRVVAAVEKTWRGLGEDVDVVHAGPVEEAIDYTVVVPRLRQVECFLRRDQPLERASGKLVSLVDDGWQVCALLPTSALGEAHGAFRGLSIRLQGWWERDQDGEIRFTSPERP